MATTRSFLMLNWSLRSSSLDVNRVGKPLLWRVLTNSFTAEKCKNKCNLVLLTLAKDNCSCNLISANFRGFPSSLVNAMKLAMEPDWSAGGRSIASTATTAPRPSSLIHLTSPETSLEHSNHTRVVSMVTWRVYHDDTGVFHQ